MAISGALITDQHTIFATRRAAQEFVNFVSASADEGETFHITEDPKRSGRCLVEMHFNGKFECLC